MSANKFLLKSSFSVILCLAILPDAQGQAMPMNMPMPHAGGHHHDREIFTFGEPAVASAATRTIKVAMKDLSFEPVKLSLHRGETIHFAITNTSLIDHEFVLGDAATQKGHREEMAAMANSGHRMMHDDPNGVSVSAKGTATLIWSFTRSGIVEYDCNIPGHYEQGMKGTIEVQ